MSAPVEGSLLEARAQPPRGSSGAPPGAPPDAPPFHAALETEWARTAVAEGLKESQSHAGAGSARAGVRMPDGRTRHGGQTSSVPSGAEPGAEAPAPGASAGIAATAAEAGTAPGRPPAGGQGEAESIGSPAVSAARAEAAAPGFPPTGSAPAPRGLGYPPPVQGGPATAPPVAQGVAGRTEPAGDATPMAPGEHALTDPSSPSAPSPATEAPATPAPAGARPLPPGSQSEGSGIPVASGTRPGDGAGSAIAGNASSPAPQAEASAQAMPVQTGSGSADRADGLPAGRPGDAAGPVASGATPSGQAAVAEETGPQGSNDGTVPASAGEQAPPAPAGNVLATGAPSPAAEVPATGAPSPAAEVPATGAPSPAAEVPATGALSPAANAPRGAGASAADASPSTGARAVRGTRLSEAARPGLRQSSARQPDPSTAGAGNGGGQDQPAAGAVKSEATGATSSAVVAETLEAAPDGPSGAGGTGTEAPAGPAGASPVVQDAPGEGGGPVLSYGVGLQRALEAVNASIEMAVRGGLAQARIALEPEELGEIRIHLTQTASGLLARVTAESPAAAQALAAGHVELRQSLTSAGLSLARLHIGQGEQVAAGTGEGPAGGREGGWGAGGADDRARPSGSPFVSGPDEGDAALDAEANKPAEAGHTLQGSLIDVLA